MQAPWLSPRTMNRSASGYTPSLFEEHAGLPSGGAHQHLRRLHLAAPCVNSNRLASELVNLLALVSSVATASCTS